MGILSKIRNTALLVSGHGVELSRETWDREYGAGDWQYLHGLDQLPRYWIVAAYARHFRPGGRVLEIGCGEGILQRMLAPDGYDRYLGVDLSEPAINVAMSATNDERCTFQQCDAAEWEPDDSYDIIIFNEVLYYFFHPVAVLQKYERALKPNGIFIISMYLRSGNTKRIWKHISRPYNNLHETRLSSARRNTWIVRVLGTTGREEERP